MEKDILRKVAEDPRGLLSPVDLINGIAKRDRRSIENLVAKGYINEVPQDVPGYPVGTINSINFYRASEKGHIFLKPWYQKCWSWIKGDVRTVIISVITSIITLLIGLLIESQIR